MLAALLEYQKMKEHEDMDRVAHEINMLFSTSTASRSSKTSIYQHFKAQQEPNWLAR